VKHQLVGFPHISKTGGTTILTILRSTFGTSHCDVESWRNKRENATAQDLKRLLKVYPHLESISGHAFRPHEGYETVRPISYFAMFREPITRCISEFQHQIEMRGRDWSFEHYIKRVGFNNQTRFLCGSADHEAAIKIIEEKFNKLVFQGRLNCSYAIKKAAKKNSIRNEILADEAKIALIKECNAEDFKLYQYVKEVKYPEHKKAYGHSLENDLSNFAPLGFNQTNIRLNRLYRNAVYKPALRLHRFKNRSSAKK